MFSWGYMCFTLGGHEVKATIENNGDSYETNAVSTSSSPKWYQVFEIHRPADTIVVNFHEIAEKADFLVQNKYGRFELKT